MTSLRIHVNYDNQAVLVLELLMHASTTKTSGKNDTDMPTTTRQPLADSYMALIAEFPLRRIRSAGEHARAKALLLRLSSRKADRGAAEYLDVLIDLIADFERRSDQAVDTSVVSAADLVRHRIEQRGMSVSALARAIGVRSPTSPKCSPASATGARPLSAGCRGT